MPSHSGCGRVWCTGFQPMCGTLSLLPRASTIASVAKRSHPSRQQRPAPACRLPRCGRTASEARGRCRGTAWSRAASRPRRAGRARRARACSRASRSGRATRRAAAPRTTSRIAGDHDRATRARHARAPSRPSAGCPCRSRRRRCRFIVEARSTERLWSTARRRARARIAFAPPCAARGRTP